MHAKLTENFKISTLKKRADFLRLNAKAKKWVSSSLILQAMPSDAPEADMTTNIHVGFTVTKKTFKSAVKRNRIKRRFRSIAAEILGSRAKAGYDYVLIARPCALDKSYALLKKDLAWCLKRMTLLREQKNDSA